MNQWLCPLPFGCRRGKCSRVLQKMLNCLSSSSLSYSIGPIFSSFSTKSLALIHRLEWCHSHCKTCHFQSASLFRPTSQYMGGDYNTTMRRRVVSAVTQLPASDVVVWTYCSVLSSLGAAEAQVFTWPPEDAYPPIHYPTQLAQSPLASQLCPLHWCKAWNGVTLILKA